MEAFFPINSTAKSMEKSLSKRAARAIRLENSLEAEVTEEIAILALPPLAEIPEDWVGEVS
jgi:uncharacterized protein with von Willebrand factor type A (vWA) domain